MSKATDVINLLEVLKEEGKILKTGASAYYDALTGLIRCKVLSVKSKYKGMEGIPSIAWGVKVKLTGEKKVPGYTKGEEIETNALRVIPLKSLVVRGGQYRIARYT